jgi:predicted TIM-barrel fold metal-dependent hydrolase
VRPWLLAVVALFGPDRSMLGSDLPIERLRSGFEPLYRAYDEIFAGQPPRDREMLLRATAEQWYGAMWSRPPGRRGEGLGTSPRSAAPDGSRDRR